MGPHADIQEMYKAIEALLILHNICIEYGDKLEDIWGYDPKDDFNEEEFEEPQQDADVMIIDDTDSIPARETDGWLKRQGRAKQMIIFNELFPTD
jgi:hypothetical protein